MRENRGSEIVKELTGKDVPTILDPVFMFDKEGWEKLIPVKEKSQNHIFLHISWERQQNIVKRWKMLLGSWGVRL